MSEPIAPTIIYPNGGDSLFGNNVVIEWSNSSSNDSSISYDIFFTTDYKADEEPNWQLITSVPSTAVTYTWYFGNSTRTTNGRIAIRAKNNQGQRSDYTVSANSFSIQRKKLDSPTVLNPTPNTRYDRFIDIIVDDSGIIGTYSQRSYYQFYYSSALAGIARTSIAQNVPIGSPPVLWNTSNLQPSDDYEVQVFLSDDDGNISDSVVIKNVKIAHEGFFIVDTIPPIASIVVNDDDVFTNKQEVNVNIVSYDEATAVHSMLLTDGTVTSKPDAIANVKRFTLDSENGLKYVQLKLQDFGGNRSGDDEKQQRILETLAEEDNTEFVDIALDDQTNTAWAISTGDTQGIYKIKDFPSFVLTISEEPTSIAFYKSSVYVTVKDSSNKGVFYRYDGASLVDSYSFTESDSIVNSMTTHNGDLFLGMENGIVYKFDGLNFYMIEELSNPVKYMFSDGNLLYLVQKNNFNVFVYNGTTFFSTGE
jgi:hypothetical protein